jgi:hypothetical protein
VIISELAFVLWVGLLYYAIGILTKSLIKNIINHNSFFITSISGFCFVSLLSNILYYCNINTYIIFIFLNLISLIGLLNCLKNQEYICIINKSGKLGISFKGPNWANWFVCLVSLVLLTLPGIIGSTQFVLFRGNHYDAYNYLEMSSTYARFSHHDVVSLDTPSLTSLHGFYTAAWYMHERPLVAIVYAVIQHFNPGNFTHLHYYYLIYSLFLAGGLLGLILSELTGQSKRWICYISGFSFVFGFWGQYILDLDAWSQVAWTPLELLFIFIWIKYSIRTNQHTMSNLIDWPFLSYFIALSVCSFCMYFEGYLFFGLPLSIISIFYLSRTHLKRYIITSLIVIFSTFIVSSFFIDLIFAIKHVSGNSSPQVSSVGWWHYYDSYFFGNSGAYFPNLITFLNEILSSLGLYFITPSQNTYSLITIIYIGLTSVALFFIIYLIYFKLRTLTQNLYYRSLCIINLIALSECSILVYNHQYWGAGKCLSYTAIFIYITLYGSLLSADKAKFFIRTLSGLMCLLLISLQIYFSFHRIYCVSTQPTGIHYTTPYPSAQDAGLMKKVFNFNDLSFLTKIKPTDEVGLDIEDPWVEHYIQLVLIEHSIPYHLELPICEQPKFNVRKGYVTAIKPTTIRLHLAIDKSSVFPYYIKADSI